MNVEFNFKTLAEFLAHFNNEEVCREHFAAIRFAKGEYCPHCNYNEIYKFAGGKRYRCAKCKQDFTIKTGTVFGESKISLHKWFIAIYLLSTSGKGISSVQLAKQVGVTQKTGWFIDHRIREAMQQNGGQLFGRVEADETFIGGLSKNMHKKKREATIKGTGGTGKTAVFGMRSRGGEVRAQVVRTVGSVDLHREIKNNLAQGATLYTDMWVAYRGLNVQFNHSTVDHGAKEYVNGDCHTNGIESFWALFKRGYHGIYHHMSRKHLQRYVNEFTFRLNRRDRGMQQVFSDLVARVAGSEQLSYKTLTQKAA
ncbi:MAG: IS1595 family transposase [Limisphaerales bacterium]